MTATLIPPPDTRWLPKADEAPGRMPLRERIAWRSRLAGLHLRAIRAGNRARTWRLTLALPGIAGAGLIAAGIGLRFGLWAGLIAAGIFALRLDGRL